MVLLAYLMLSFECAWACRSQETINKTKSSRFFFGDNSTWGGWSPPEGDNSWMTWITLWGTENSSNFDSTEEGRGAETGWPQYWKGLGQGNAGVPPPPWAYVPLSYGKPQYCFFIPKKGNCGENLTRWGFNPTTNKCHAFEFSGCGGNQNNFRDESSCKAECVDVPSTDCEAPSKINFEDMIF